MLPIARPTAHHPTFRALRLRVVGDEPAWFEALFFQPGKRDGGDADFYGCLSQPAQDSSAEFPIVSRGDLEGRYTDLSLTLLEGAEGRGEAVGENFPVRDCSAVVSLEQIGLRGTHLLLPLARFNRATNDAVVKHDRYLQTTVLSGLRFHADFLLRIRWIGCRRRLRYTHPASWR